MHTHTVYVCVNFFLTWLTKCGKNDMKNTHTITQSVCTALNTTEWAKSEKSGYTNNKLNISKKRRRSKEEDVHVGHKHISIQINKKKNYVGFATCFASLGANAFIRSVKVNRKAKGNERKYVVYPIQPRQSVEKLYSQPKALMGSFFSAFCVNFFAAVCTFAELSIWERNTWI